MPTHPLYTCCSPLASPDTVVSFRTVCTPLSTVTWAMPAPIRPAPKIARVLVGNNKNKHSSTTLKKARVCESYTLFTQKQNLRIDFVSNQSKYINTTIRPGFVC